MQINIYTTLLIDWANLCMVWKDFHIDKEMIFKNFDFDCICLFEQMSENKQ